QVLDDVQDRLSELAERLPAIRRDKEEVLRLNVELADFEHRLKTHRKSLQNLDDVQEELEVTTTLLRTCKALVKNALTTSADASKRIERDVARVVQAEVKSKEQPRKQRTDERPRDLSSALEAAGMSVSEDVQRAIRHFESEYLAEYIDKAAYRELLVRFVE